MTAAVQPSGDSFGPAFAEANDQLVRSIFDAGLRMHKLGNAIERDPTTSREFRTAVADVLDELDSVIRAAGLAMLALTRDHGTALAPAVRHSRKFRKR
ncbi:hypothetical protein [Nocardia terpenica]|uniref:Uncharacterized protein n=1 Tax=Nocardia terpenica TaxID=455432 RepID=A0A6G9YZD9_9NOCA|nr:hypothetical protein [Nocardia terpenica]QIS18183.1 hypothetical protein F6W96_07590 [Nocardia terpenica]